MKSEAEKQAIKSAKQEYKSGKSRIGQSTFASFKEESCAKPPRILSGIMEGEKILPDDHPVYGDYLYVVDDEAFGVKGKVIRSDVFGDVRKLKADLRSLGYKAENIHNCKMGLRNLF